MITLYSGTPGSGKSLHLAREIAEELSLRKKNVIANFPINMPLITKNGKRKTGEFTYLTNDEITVPFLQEYARKHHKVGKEGQTLLVIDEAGIMFNSRDYGAFDRKSWIKFMMTHRHYGYNVILVSQIDRIIDRQIRGFIEYDVKHRKANNFRLLGLLLTLFRIPMFVAVTYWYGVRERCGAELFRFRKRDSQLYDTMMLFGDGHHGERIVGEESDSSPVSADEGHHPDDAADGDGAPAPPGGPHPARRMTRMKNTCLGKLRCLWSFFNRQIRLLARGKKKTADCNTNGSPGSGPDPNKVCYNPPVDSAVSPPMGASAPLPPRVDYMAELLRSREPGEEVHISESTD